MRTELEIYEMQWFPRMLPIVESDGLHARTGNVMLYCLKLYQRLKAENNLHTFASIVKERITAPNIEAISNAAGGEMDPGYVAYLILYAMQRKAVREGHK